MGVVDKVLERPYADASRTGIYGYSYGGYMTSWTIGQTDRFKACVCGAPCFDLESFYGTSDIGHTFGRTQFGWKPYEGEAWYKAHSPSTFAHRATTPTLIIHGEEDHRCPIGQGEQLFVSLSTPAARPNSSATPAAPTSCCARPARPPGGFPRPALLGWFTDHLGLPLPRGEGGG